MNSLRILIVEDSRTSQVGLAGFLRRIPGFSPQRLEMAESTSEALEHFGPGKASPDLVILDLEMPGGPGEGLIEALKARPAPMPEIIVTSGTTDARRVERVKALGPSAYLAKPYDPSALVEAIRAAKERIAARQPQPAATPEDRPCPTS